MDVMVVYIRKQFFLLGSANWSANWYTPSHVSIFNLSIICSQMDIRDLNTLYSKNSLMPQPKDIAR